MQLGPMASNACGDMLLAVRLAESASWLLARWLGEGVSSMAFWCLDSSDATWGNGGGSSRSRTCNMRGSVIHQHRVGDRPCSNECFGGLASSGFAAPPALFGLTLVMATTQTRVSATPR